MPEETNEPQDVETTEVEEEAVEETPEPTDDINELKSRLQRLEEKSITQRERTRMLRQELEKARKAAAPKEAPSKTGELDETQLDYLDLKGITDQEDITIIQSVMKRTGISLREALKDEYVVSKLEANKKDREVKDATPSSTKRSGGQTNDLATAIAKHERTGEYPTDFKLRAQLVDHLVQKSTNNKPAWH